VFQKHLGGLPYTLNMNRQHALLEQFAQRKILLLREMQGWSVPGWMHFYSSM
jgi:hypothetical protein